MGNNNDNSSDKVCMVYDKEDFFTVIVQIVLAAAALASLYIKRHYEQPRRRLGTWALDISKQALGACYAHVLNMIIAAVISQNLRGEIQLDDQCAWYGLSYLIDTTLGLLLAIGFLKLLDWAAHEQDWVHLKHSGVYVGPSAYWHWAAQVTAWMIILTLVKIIIYAFMWLCSEPLAWLGGLLFAPLQGNIHFELVFVMILFPGLLNVIYFWIADSYLQAGAHHHGAHEPSDDNDKAQALMEAETGQQQQQPPPAKPSTWTSLETEKATIV